MQLRKQMWLRIRSEDCRYCADRTHKTGQCPKFTRKREDRARLKPKHEMSAEDFGL